MRRTWGKAGGSAGVPRAQYSIFTISGAARRAINIIRGYGTWYVDGSVAAPMVKQGKSVVENAKRNRNA